MRGWGAFDMFATAFGLMTLLWFSIALTLLWLCVLSSCRLFSCLTLFRLQAIIYNHHTSFDAFVHSCVCFLVPELEYVGVTFFRDVPKMST